MRLASVLLSCVFFLCSTPALAGFDKGVLAFENEDFQAALKEFLPLAKAGNAAAMTYVARVHDEGMDQPAEALPWYLKAAQKGRAEAQTRLAQMYEEGVGVEQDVAAAMTWYQKAAAQGDDEAQLALGEHAEDDLDDNQSAAGWYEKAATQDNAEAQYRLGLLLISDEGVARDVPRAWMMLTLAANNDIGEAIQARDVLELEMEPVELRQAQALLQQWEKTH